MAISTFSYRQVVMFANVAKRWGGRWSSNVLVRILQDKVSYVFSGSKEQKGQVQCDMDSRIQDGKKRVFF